LTRGQNVLLANELLQRPGPHAGGQRRPRAGSGSSLGGSSRGLHGWR
jgi:hypothetical protein